MLQPIQARPSLRGPEGRSNRPVPKYQARGRPAGRPYIGGPSGPDKHSAQRRFRQAEGRGFPASLRSYPRLIFSVACRKKTKKGAIVSFETCLSALTP
jgi:hypothetical protein